MFERSIFSSPGPRRPSADPKPAPISQILLVTVVSGLLSSCGGPKEPDRVPVIDLVEEFAWADPIQEVRDLAIGEPAGRAFLSNGWSGNEGSDHDPFVWGLGERSTLTVPVAKPRDLRLRVDLRPFSYPSSPAQGVEIRLGGQSIADFELEPNVRRSQEILLPKESLRSGGNELTFHWSWSRSPRQAVGARDGRRLAAAVYGARLYEADGPCDEGQTVGPPTSLPRAEEGRIWLPWGTRLELFVDLPDQAELLSEVGIRGRGTLEIDVLSEGATDGPEVVDLMAESGELRRALPTGPGLVRLRLTALGREADGGARLAAPVILGIPPAEDESEPSEIAAPAPERRSGLVIYSVDTLRADRLGYRGGPVETPVLDAFAAEAVVFEDLVAQSPWTKASMASIFTGLWPPSHGAVNRRNLLEPGLVTLAELLHAEGWATAAVITNPNITESFGFQQGFEHFEYLGEKVSAGGVNEVVDGWLAERQDDRPLFLWVHTLDPHSPYDPPDAFRTRRVPEISGEFAEASLDVVNELRAGRRAMDGAVMADLIALYDTEIAYADASFGDFLDILSRHGLGDSTVTFASDHGEEFLEHGNLEHGRALHVESLDVPWMVRGPGLPAQRITASAQHIDILPTLLSWLGLRVPAGLEGHAWLTGQGRLRPAAEERLIFSHLHLDGDERLSVSDGRFKLLSVIRGGKPQRGRLFDIQSDRGETSDVSDRFPVRRGWLKRMLRQRLVEGTAGRGQEVVFDEETRKSLEALGYL